MAKVQIDIEEELHLDIKILHAKLEKETKKKKSLRETYQMLVKKGLESFKKENPTK
jgi:hypothetical protein